MGVLHHYIFIISQLCLTSHPRSTVVLLDTRTSRTSRKIYVEDANGETPLNWTQELLEKVEEFMVRMLMRRLELATPGLRTQCSSH